ncbi:hypothetical protein [Fulvimarina endophytica]|uniref:hypothetical protein n=1 Tax=Fulvimarina endophytica TaxID=2293836 RepID=UPI0011C04C25|nr:hypothetical protein [Fulvimarina endophytica]
MTGFYCKTCRRTSSSAKHRIDRCPACGGPTIDLDRSRALAARNDAFRRQLAMGWSSTCPAGEVIVTPDVAALGHTMESLILRSIGLRTTFPRDEPDTEHAVGVGRIGDKAFDWTISVESKPNSHRVDDRFTRRTLSVRLLSHP